MYRFPVAVFLLPLSLLVLLPLGCTSSSDNLIDSRLDSEAVQEAEASIKNRLKDVVALLDAGKYQEFLESYSVPSELARIKANPNFNMEELIEEVKGNADVLRNLLDEVSNKTPRITKDRTQAWFAMEDPKAPSEFMVFEKIDQQWYIMNHPPEKFPDDESETKKIVEATAIGSNPEGLIPVLAEGKMVASQQTEALLKPVQQIVMQQGMAEVVKDQNFFAVKLMLFGEIYAIQFPGEQLSPATEEGKVRMQKTNEIKKALDPIAMRLLQTTNADKLEIRFPISDQE